MTKYSRIQATLKHPLDRFQSIRYSTVSRIRVITLITGRVSGFRSSDIRMTEQESERKKENEQFEMPKLRPIYSCFMTLSRPATNLTKSLAAREGHPSYG
ncbi:hypothetical protein HanIR_Chr05g0222201 [Helianthus annuus]|nr:hypothetical protein HanIR_Chr05g0222201 [Helianthus annuus]